MWERNTQNKSCMNVLTFFSKSKNNGFKFLKHLRNFMKHGQYRYLDGTAK